MAKFGNNNDDFNEFNDEFSDRWEEFNRMMNDRWFNRDYNMFHSDLEELMRLINLRRRDWDNPMNFKFIPLTNPIMDDLNQNDFNILKNEMEIEKGSDENGDWEIKRWTSPDGSMSFSSFTRSSSFGDTNHLADEIAQLFGSKIKNRETKKTNSEEVKKIKLAKLQKTLDYLVKQEKYEKAAEIKKMIDNLNNPPTTTEGENNA